MSFNILVKAWISLPTNKVARVNIASGSGMFFRILSAKTLASSVPANTQTVADWPKSPLKASPICFKALSFCWLKSDSVDFMPSNPLGWFAADFAASINCALDAIRLVVVDRDCGNGKPPAIFPGNCIFVVANVCAVLAIRSTWAKTGSGNTAEKADNCCINSANDFPVTISANTETWPAPVSLSAKWLIALVGLR
nr:hypothetical protein [Providencia sp.]